MRLLIITFILHVLLFSCKPKTYYYSFNKKNTTIHKNKKNDDSLTLTLDSSFQIKTNESKFKFRKIDILIVERYKSHKYYDSIKNEHFNEIVNISISKLYIEIRSHKINSFDLSFEILNENYISEYHKKYLTKNIKTGDVAIFDLNVINKEIIINVINNDNNKFIFYIKEFHIE